jgi:hypothetical protein
MLAPVEDHGTVLEPRANRGQAPEGPRRVYREPADLISAAVVDGTLRQEPRRARITLAGFPGLYEEFG